MQATEAEKKETLKGCLLLEGLGPGNYYYYYYYYYYFSHKSLGYSS